MTSVNNYTTVESDEQEREQPRISNGFTPKTRTSDCNRDCYEKGWDQPRRDRKTYRSTTLQRQQGDAPEAASDRRFSTKDVREYRSRSGNEGQETKGLKKASGE